MANSNGKRRTFPELVIVVEQSLVPDAAGRVRRALDIALRAANDPAGLALMSAEITVSKNVSRQEGIKQDEPEQKAGGEQDGNYAQN